MFSFFKTKKLLDTIRQAQSWLKFTISPKHPDFKYNSVDVEKTLREVMHEDNEQTEIFPGVFATPIGNSLLGDPKLVPLKLIKVMPGAVIPLHRHGGFEYYQLLAGSELVDTRGKYNEHCGCVSEADSVHAVTNIGSTASYALIALPTKLELNFLKGDEALNVLALSYSNIKSDAAYQPHNIFLQLLYAEKLFENNQIDEATGVLEKLDLREISNEILKKQMETLQFKLSPSDLVVKSM